MRSWSNFVKLSGVITVVALVVFASVGGNGVQAGSLAQATGTATMITTPGATASGTTPATLPGTVPATLSGTVPASTGATTVPPTTAAGGGAAATTVATAAAGAAFAGCPPAITSGLAGMMEATEEAGNATMEASGTEMAGMESTMEGTEEAASTMEASGTEEAAVMPSVFKAGGCLFSTVLEGSNEVPEPGPKDAYGTAAISVDTTLGQVCFALDVEGLQLPATAAHIHKGAAGVAGPVVVPLTAPDANGKSEGCIDKLDTALLRDILDNPTNYYVNVHTKDFPNGAARGQLTSAVKMSGAIEVPPGDPDGFGVATFAADSTGELCYALMVEGIQLPATAAHIHKGAAGVAGPVVIPLEAPDADGVSHGCVSDADKAVVADILANPANYYVNVHTTDFPQGALRGQLSGH